MGTPDRIPEIPRTTLGLQRSPRTDSLDASAKAKSAVKTFSIARGGAVHDFVARFPPFNAFLSTVRRRILILAALTWLPLLVLSVKDGVALGHQVRIPFLYDLSMYGRFLIGLPLLVAAETVIDPPVRRGLAELVETGIVPDQELPQFENLLQKMQRLRLSAVPGIILATLAFFPTFLFQHEWTYGAVSNWHTTARGLTAAGWWFAVFSSPMLRFIIYRWAFRYFIWALLLRRLGKMRLVLMPTHPDRAGGLNVLGITQKRFGILFGALGCGFAGRIANGIVFEGMPLSSYQYLMVGFLLLSVIAGLFPLALLAPKLNKVRRSGLLEYGRLADTYSKLFDQKWVHNSEPPSEPLLGTSDIQSLANMGSSYRLVDAMRIAPISKRLVVRLALQAALPLIPVIILGTPVPELHHLEKLLQLILKMVV